VVIGIGGGDRACPLRIQLDRLIALAKDPRLNVMTGGARTA
jgi:hypothetical protein